MKIFFLPGAYDGCYLYRGYYPGLYSGSLVASDFILKAFDKSELLRKALEADIVVVQRPNDPVRVEIAELLKKKGKKIIFDNDDTYLPDVGVPLSMLKSDKQREMAKVMNDNLYKILRIADGATASTEMLAEEFRQVNKKVKVLKNCIDPDDEFPLAPNKTGKFRVMFVGSVVSNDDYIHIKEHIRRLDERGDVTIIVFGIVQVDGSIHGAYNDDYAFWNSLKNVEWQGFVPVNEYMYTISKLAPDLAIIPRKDSYFNRCKSNVKFLEMSLLHVPVIAQGFADKKSPYQKPSDARYMTIVTDNDTWYDKIIEIKDNYAKFKKKADLAHDYVIKNYNVKEYAKVWRETIIKLVK